MTCNFMRDESGKLMMVVCGPGPYSFLVEARCPWCCLGEDTVTVAARWVHGGWSGTDCICGACGQFWMADDDGPLKGTPNDEREKNLAIVAEMLTRMKPGDWPVPPALVPPDEDVR